MCFNHKVYKKNKAVHTLMAYDCKLYRQVVTHSHAPQIVTFSDFGVFMRLMCKQHRVEAVT